MLENSKLARNYTPIFSYRMFQYLGVLTFAEVSIFLQKISVFCPKKYLHSKQQCEDCVRDFLVLSPVFVRQKVTINENLNLSHSVSGIHIPDCSKLAENLKNKNNVTIFLQVFFSLVKFSYWPKFHANIITGSGIITIFFYKGLTRFPKIGNTPI